MDDSVFRKKIELYTSQYNALKLKAKKLSVARLFAFVSFFIATVYLANSRAGIGFYIVPFVLFACFFLLVNSYTKVQFLLKRTALLKTINVDEIKRKGIELEKFDGGNAYADESHFYTSDLHVFGEYSIFQLINRCVSKEGKEKLAQWLGKREVKAVVEQRQSAVIELAGKFDWRQALQVSAMHYKGAGAGMGKLVTLVKEPRLLAKSFLFYKTLLLSMSVLSISALSYFVMNLKSVIIALAVTGDLVSYIPVFPLLAVVAINAFILRRKKAASEDVIFKTQNFMGALGAFQQMVSLIEKEAFIAELLVGLKKELRQEAFFASKELKRLRENLLVLQLRGRENAPFASNSFYSLLNYLFLLDIYCLLRLEQWKLLHSEHFEKWVSAMSEVEALSSLGGFSYLNPHYSFPQISDKDYLLEFQQLGHPLIPEDQRVSNDFSLNEQGQICLITGSNMSGKSTFLRTVGVNMVLAFAGAPICASAATISGLTIFTSIQTKDSLWKSVSGFYAELKRIEQLLKLLKTDEPVVFFIDEIMKGTNSLDRQVGAVSLVRQLSKLNAFGMITTHDIELSKFLEDAENVLDYSFNSSIEKDEILFDYKITKGRCQNFNASALMKKIGIDILSDIHSKK
ncbi:hypothetical protein R9C00_01225 [Flammeovirgaceae bacterium SG7u.111]|nr:hypothetical protein [Flammeovirgaceae bacterium SG7u.132]WPO36070.1 hypothetical protein R9C00_01225 [Flammeovirgaceae bacterium SG7u.111]